MSWHDSHKPVCFVFNSNVGESTPGEAKSQLQKEFGIDRLAIEASFCITTSKAPGLSNTGSNLDIVQISYLLLKNDVAGMPFFRISKAKKKYWVLSEACFFLRG